MSISWRGSPLIFHELGVLLCSSSRRRMPGAKVSIRSSQERTGSRLGSVQTFQMAQVTLRQDAQDALLGAFGTYRRPCSRRLPQATGTAQREAASADYHLTTIVTRGSDWYRG